MIEYNLKLNNFFGCAEVGAKLINTSNSLQN